MALFRRLRGTIETLFQVGLGGPQLKNSSGQIEARNAADSAYAEFRALILRRGQAVGSTSAPTTTSGSFVVVPQMSVTITTKGGDVLVTFSASVDLQNGDNWDFALFTDNAQEGNSNRHVNVVGTAPLLGTAPAIPGLPVSVTKLVTGLSAGSHTFEARWKVTGGTARMLATDRILTCVEVF